MEISANMTNIEASKSTATVKTNFTEKISKDEASEIRAQITENANKLMMQSITTQTELNSKKLDTTTPEEFKEFLSDIGYEGKPIAELSQEEAAELVSEDGFFGIEQTSDRIANFVINGSGGDEKLMRAGREGMLEGFKAAEAMWGGELPEISQKTMQAAIEKVDKAMYDLGFSIINEEA
jgi:arsenate reductase-like glutaredoxin family protein